MRGCLSFIIKTVFAVLLFFGLKYLGAVDFLQEKISDYLSNSHEEQVQKAQDIVDLSQIDDEYTIDRTFKILKNKAILAQHNATSQKIIIFESKNPNILSKQDLTQENIQEKIDNLAKKYKNKFIKFDKTQVVKQGKFNGIEQSIPYVRVKAEIPNFPVKDIEGVVAAADLDDGKKVIIFSFNEKDKYSQIITESFFKKVKKVRSV